MTEKETKRDRSYCYGGRRAIAKATAGKMIKKTEGMNRQQRRHLLSLGRKIAKRTRKLIGMALSRAFVKLKKTHCL